MQHHTQSWADRRTAQGYNALLSPLFFLYVSAPASEVLELQILITMLGHHVLWAGDAAEQHSVCLACSLF